jgi:hypothetical protein
LQDKPLNLKTQLFIDDLKNDPKLQDWQIAQAESAINLYIHHFQADNKALHVSEGTPLPNGKIFPNIETINNKIREALRIKHYAYTTERTYTDWFHRFHEYLTKVRNKDWETQGADGDDVRDYLSHLAIKQRVAASTQNQAFNALLFLFRNVLEIDLTDLRIRCGPNAALSCRLF